MEVEEIIDDSQPALYGGSEGSYKNESISVQKSAMQKEIMKGSSRQNRVLFYSATRQKDVQQLGSILQKDKSFHVNAEFISNRKDKCILEAPRKSIKLLGSTRREGLSGIPSVGDKCSICGQFFLDYGRLVEHVMLHFKETGNGASVSAEAGNGASISTEAGNGASISTEAGNGAFVSTGAGNGASVSIGAADKKNEQYTCYVCQKSFMNRYSLRRHVENLHAGGIPSIICTWSNCGTLVKHSELRKHIIESHIRVGNYFHCFVCLAVFGTTDGNQTSNILSSLSNSKNSTHVNQPVEPMNFQGSNKALSTCVDCGSRQLHKVKYKVHKDNLLTFKCDQCPTVDIKTCFIKLTCKGEKYRRHENICRFCRIRKNEVEYVKELAQKSRQDQAFGQHKGSMEIIEISDEDEAYNSVSGEKSINVCSSNKNDSIELLESYSTSAKFDVPCDEDDIEIIEEHITDVSQIRSTALVEAEDYIKMVERECIAQYGKEIIDLN